IVNTRNQSMPTKLSTNGSNRCSSSGIVICGYQILLGLNCDSISHVYCPMQCYARLPGERTTWRQPDISGDCGRSGIGDCRASQYRKTRGCSEVHCRLGCREHHGCLSSLGCLGHHSYHGYLSALGILSYLSTLVT